MSLIAFSQLPTYARLRDEGVDVLTVEEARPHAGRALHIGLLNMMPDKALAATERQFMRLLGRSDVAIQVHLFTLPGLGRAAPGKAHVAAYYESFDQIRSTGLDALVISGANVEGNALANQAFWQPLSEVLAWAADAVDSTLCSCLATHAALQLQHGQERVALPEKRWGVYSHQIKNPAHPLVSSLPEKFAVPHSRYNEITAAQFGSAGVTVLVESEEGEVHLAVSEDGMRFVYFQGHPEYDTISLLKEYKREVSRFVAGKLAEFPPSPDHYFPVQAQEIVQKYRREQKSGSEWPSFPETLLSTELTNTWREPAQRVIDNWLSNLVDVYHR
jgi:homoserine O-succinyltransferase